MEELLPIYPNQITHEMDMAKNGSWKSYGVAPGLTYLIETIPDFLRQKGLEEYYQKIFFGTPKKLFSFFK